MNEAIGSSVPVGATAETTPGVIPHLMALLWGEYRAHLEARMKAAPGKYRTADDALLKAPAAGFYAFAVRYLDGNRPVGTFACDRNVGLRFKDNRVAVVAVAHHVGPLSAMAPEGEEARRYAAQFAPPPSARAMPISSPGEVDHSGAINVI